MVSILTLRRPWAAVPALLTALLLAVGCSSTPKDETSAWTPEKLYSEARDEANAGNYERAGKLFERLEGRAAGTLLAQQAQLERAHILYKSNEKAQALTVLERFIKLHPTSPAFDYALYLQGLVNFNDNLGLFGNLSKQDLSERDQQASRDSYQSFKQRSARGALLFSARCLCSRGEPRAASRQRLPGVPGRRRSAVHHDPVLRPAWPGPVAR
jgi:outer membrane protein assembly factor BamD